MGNFKKIAIFSVLLFLTASCFANQISFQIVQHDDSADNVTEDSMIIEDSVLNTFFEYGYIVTNSDAAISDSESQDERLYKIGSGDAFNGFSDYFIQIKLYYERTDETLTASSDLYKINFTIASVKSGVKIAEKSLENLKVDRTKKNNLAKISSDLVNQINKALKANKA
jgi:hypothetical protein